MIPLKHFFPRKNSICTLMISKKAFHGITISLMLLKINNIEASGAKRGKSGAESEN